MQPQIEQWFYRQYRCHEWWVDPWAVFELRNLCWCQLGMRLLGKRIWFSRWMGFHGFCRGFLGKVNRFWLQGGKLSLRLVQHWLPSSCLHLFPSWDILAGERLCLRFIDGWWHCLSSGIFIGSWLESEVVFQWWSSCLVYSQVLDHICYILIVLLSSSIAMSTETNSMVGSWVHLFQFAYGVMASPNFIKLFLI